MPDTVPVIPPEVEEIGGKYRRSTASAEALAAEVPGMRSPAQTAFTVALNGMKIDSWLKAAWVEATAAGVTIPA